MKTLVHVPLVALLLLLLPAATRAQTDKPGTVATNTAKPGTETTSTAISQQKPVPDQEQAPVPAAVAPTSLQPFVPVWLLLLFLLIGAGEILLVAVYFGIGRRIGPAQTAAHKAQSAIEDLKKSVDDAGTKLTALRDEVNAIRRSQDPILAIAINRLASSSQFPFAPQITEISPDHGVPGGGTQVNITGRNFSPDAQVWFGGINQPAKSTSTTNRLDVTSPAGSAGEVDIYVVNPNGMMSQQQRPLSYRYALFRLAEISNPAAADATLRLTGEGFSNTTRVLIDGRNADRVTVQNDKAIELPIPAGAAKGDTRRVVLANDGGDRSEERTFTQP